MLILGISAYYHDSAVCLIRDGEILKAVQEERYTRIKNDAQFPKNSISNILEEFNLNINDLDYVVFYEKPFVKFERLLETYVKSSPKGFKSFYTSIPFWVKEKLFQKNIILKELRKFDKSFSEKKLLFSDHHLSHAASAYYPSPFNNAIILTLDGVGEWNTTAIFLGEQNKIQLKEYINFPDSIGLLYSSFTQYLGFKVNEDEYKVMGLAPYGKPKYLKLILKKILKVNKNGSFKMNMKLFNYEIGLTMINEIFEEVFQCPTRKKSEQINQFHMDIASSIQLITEQIILRILRYAKKKYNKKFLCLAGGVALNCVANGKILKSKLFDDIWIQPASGDAGGALGAALLIWYQKLNNQKIAKKNIMKNSLLGDSFSSEDIKKDLDLCKANYKLFSYNEMVKYSAENIKKGKTIGWFQNRSEFGPRALGSRSIIADPRDPKMQKKLNLQIKFRESFRPFAPVVLEEEANKWFDIDCSSPYMLLVADVKKKDLIPAVTHVDNTARIQTVNIGNKEIYDLLVEFNNITNCPVLINTSFNINREPIVNNIKDAYRSFLISGLDILVCGNFVLEKEKQYDQISF